MGLVYLAYPYLGRPAALGLRRSRGHRAPVRVAQRGAGPRLRLRLPLRAHQQPDLAASTSPVWRSSATAVLARVQRAGGAETAAPSSTGWMFLETFLYEVRDWPVWEFVTGSFPLTPLSPGSCGSLSFYEPSCSARPIRASATRSSCTPSSCGPSSTTASSAWSLLSRCSGSACAARAWASGTPWRCWALITLSGLSVSAFNNVFAAIVLAVAMGLDRSARQEDPQVPAADPAPPVPARGRARPRPRGRAPVAGPPVSRSSDN